MRWPGRVLKIYCHRFILMSAKRSNRILLLCGYMFCFIKIEIIVFKEIEIYINFLLFQGGIRTTRVHGPISPPKIIILNCLHTAHFNHLLHRKI